MKIIVHISHDRHREDTIKVYPYSGINMKKVEKEMKEHLTGADAHVGCFGDTPSENGYQYGWNESYYDSISIIDMEK